jgi:predicted  nucleic acid-binding Zn-ribbon protein
MADSFGDKDKGFGGTGKRPAPTIEGKATEVAVEPAEAAAAEQEESAAPAGESSALPGGDSGEAQEAPGPPSARPSRVKSFASHMLAGLLGALIGVAGLGAAWNALGLGPKPPAAPDLSGIEARIAKLESAPAPTAGSGELAELDKRLKAIEDQPSDVTPELSGLPDRVAQLETAIKSLADTAKDGGSVADAAAISEQIGEAERRLQAKIDAAIAEAELTNASTVQDLQREIAELKAKIGALAEAELNPGGDTALVPDLTALTDRIAKLEAALPALKDEIGKDSSETKSAALAIALANLRTALDEGRPFSAELATLKALAPTPEDLGPLPGYAEKGIPTLAALKRSFAAAKDAALAPTTPKAEASIWESLWASAQGLVKVRRVDAAAIGDTPDAVLARADAKLEMDDLAEAVAEVETLDGAPRAQFADWLEQAHARLDADHVLKRLEGLLLVSVGGAGLPKAE